MKQIILSLLSFFLFASYVDSQNTDWATVGASWHYEYTSFGIEGFTKYEVEKDTVVDGKLCSKVNILNEYSYFGSPGYSNTEPSFYTYEEDSILFFTTNNQFDTLMDLKASPGDSWSLTNQSCNDERLIEVLNTGSILINGCNNKWVSYTYEGFTAVVDTFYSYYGSANRAFAYYDYCDQVVDQPSSSNLRCFQDGNCFYSNGVQDCESLNIKSESRDHHEIRVYPNPSSDILNIELPIYSESKGLSFKIVDLKGRVILSEDLTNSTIDVSALETGVYFLRIERHGIHFHPQPIIIK